MIILTRLIYFEWYGDNAVHIMKIRYKNVQNHYVYGRDRDDGDALFNKIANTAVGNDG